MWASDDQSPLDLKPIPPIKKPWICAQIGAREHYAIPRVLSSQHKLERLITDYWWPPSTLLPSRAEGRWHPALAEQQVINLNWRGLTYDGVTKLGDRPDWNRIQARNEWFQRKQLEKLQRDRKRLEALPTGVFFTYSYAALLLLNFFRDLGWKTLLGQIDPGPKEAQLVHQEITQNTQYQTSWSSPPTQYWEHLSAEHELADFVLVNSTWSRQLWLQSGTPEDKIKVLPLAYETTEFGLDPNSKVKEYPEKFDNNRPLRVLFLGQINIRKGIHYLLESVQALAAEPVEFWLAGTRDIQLPAAIREHRRIIWAGPISRAQVAQYYSAADVFILPTISDGFAITQLEAQSWRLPVITTNHCGKVVHDGVNGMIVDPINAEQITSCLQRCLQDPQLLVRMSHSSRVADEFSFSALANNLNTLESD